MCQEGLHAEHLPRIQQIWLDSRLRKKMPDLRKTSGLGACKELVPTSKVSVSCNLQSIFTSGC